MCVPVAVLGVKEDEIGHVFDPFRANEAEFHHITPLSRCEACLTQCAVVSTGVTSKETFGRQGGVDSSGDGRSCVFLEEVGREE